MVYSPKIGPDGRFAKEWLDLTRRINNVETRPSGDVVIRGSLTRIDPITGVETIINFHDEENAPAKRPLIGARVGAGSVNTIPDSQYFDELHNLETVMNTAVDITNWYRSIRATSAKEFTETVVPELAAYPERKVLYVFEIHKSNSQFNVDFDTKTGIYPDLVATLQAIKDSGYADRVLLAPFHEGNGGGGLGDRVAVDGVTVSGSTTVTSQNIRFTAGDEGNAIKGAGIPDGTTIDAYVNGTTVTITAPATASATGVLLTVSKPAGIGAYPWHAYDTDLKIFDGQPTRVNTPELYKEAFRNVVTLAREMGLPCQIVQWYLAANTSDATLIDGIDRMNMENLYVGDDYVDIIGLSYYNRSGDLRYSNTWPQPGANGLREFYNAFQSMTSNPLWICETGCAPSNEYGDQAQWYADLIKLVASDELPRIEGMVMFMQDSRRYNATTGAVTQGANMKLDSDPATAVAAKKLVGRAINAAKRTTKLDSIPPMSRNLLPPAAMDLLTVDGWVHSDGVTLAVSGDYTPRDFEAASKGMHITKPGYVAGDNKTTYTAFRPVSSVHLDYEVNTPYVLSFQARASIDGFKVEAGIRQDGDDALLLGDELVLSHVFEDYVVPFSSQTTDIGSWRIPNFNFGNNTQTEPQWFEIANLRLTRGTAAQPNIERLLRPRVKTLVGNDTSSEIFWNCEAADIYTVALTSNYTLRSPSGVPFDGQEITLKMTQDSVGGRILNLHSSFHSSVAHPIIASTPGATTVLKFQYDGPAARWGIVTNAHFHPDSTTEPAPIEYTPVGHTHDASSIVSGTLDPARLPTHSHTYDDITGTVPTSALPPLAINETFPVANEAAMLALTAQRGDMAIRSDNGRTYVLSADTPSVLSAWKEVMAAGQVQSVAGKTGVVALVKADVGLGNVDNTSDASKPISTATQTALNLKINNSEKAAANGVATLDSGTKVPVAQLPAATSSAAGTMSAADKAKLDAASNTTTNNSIAVRSANGHIYANSFFSDTTQSTNANALTRKDYVDGQIATINDKLVRPLLASGTDLNTISGTADVGTHGLISGNGIYPNAPAVNIASYAVLEYARSSDARTAVQRITFGEVIYFREAIDVGLGTWNPWTQLATLDSGGKVPVAQLPAATGSAAGTMSAADKTKLDAASSTTTNGSLVVRSVNGHVYGNSFFSDVAQSTSANALTRKDYVDGKTWAGEDITSGTVAAARLPVSSNTAAGTMSSADKLKLDYIGNFVVDGSFESGLEGVSSTTGGTTERIVSEPDARTGYAFARCTRTTADVNLVFKPVRTFGDRIYRVSCWAKSPVAGAYVRVSGTRRRTLDGVFAFVGTDTDRPISTDWTYVERDLIIASDYDQYNPRFVFYGLLDGNTVDVDDVSITDVTDIIKQTENAGNVATTSTNGLMSAADKVKLDGATATSGNDTLVSRSATNSIGVGSVTLDSAPSSAGHATRKDYVDTQVGARIATADKGVANGVPSLDASAKIPMGQLPSNIPDDQYDYIEALASRAKSTKLQIKKVNSTQEVEVSCITPSGQHVTYQFYGNAAGDDYRVLANIWAGTSTATMSQTSAKSWADLTPTGTFTAAASAFVYTTDVATPASWVVPITVDVDGSDIRFHTYKDNRGGVWELKLTGPVSATVNVSTWAASAAYTYATYTTVASNLRPGTYTVTGKFLGDDPLNAPTGGVSRGWLANNAAITSATSNATLLDVFAPFRTISKDFLLKPASNMDIAMQVKPVGGPTLEWMPYHGVATMFQADAPVYLDGDVALDVGAMYSGAFKPLNSFELVQRVWGRNTSSGATNLVELATSHVIRSTGQVTVTGKWKALTDVVLGDNYVMMFPASMPIFDQLATSIGNKYVNNAGLIGTETALVAENDIAVSHLFLSSTNKSVAAAMRYNNMGETLRRGKPNKNSDATKAFLQHRDSNIVKVYNRPYVPGTTVSAGTVNRFSGDYLFAQGVGLYDQFSL